MFKLDESKKNLNNYVDTGICTVILLETTNDIKKANKMYNYKCNMDFLHD